MRTTLLIIFSTCVVMLASGQSELSGKWHTGEDNSIIQTYEKDGAWYGKIISSDNPKAKIGTNILRDYKKEGDKWIGKLYAAKRDKILKSEITVLDRALNITVFTGFITRNLIWEKSDNNDD